MIMYRAQLGLCKENVGLAEKTLVD